MRAKYFLIIILIICGSLLIESEENEKLPALQFKEEVRLLQVEVFAYDEKNNFFSGLSRDDFQLWEDGVKQEIKYVDEIHLSLPKLEGKQKKEEQTLLEKGKRFYNSVVLIFDGCNSSQKNIQLAKNAAKEFISRYGNENTWIALGYIDANGNYHIIKNFTNSSIDLINALEELKSGMGGAESRNSKLRNIQITLEAMQKCTSVDLARARLNCIESSIRQAYNQARIYAMEEQRNAKNSVESMKSIFKFLRHVPGHKSLIFFSEGFDPSGNVYYSYTIEAVRQFIYDYNLPTDIEYVLNEINQQRTTEGTKVASLIDLIKEANSSELTVYWLNPVNPMDTLGAESTFKSSIATFSEANQYLNQFKSIAEDTGGFAFQTSSQFNDFFNKINKDISSYYLISYIPKRPSHDGKVHKITVKSSKPGIKVRLRKSITDFTLDDQVNILLASALDFSEFYNQIAMENEVAFFMGEKGKINVLVNISIPFSSINALYEGEKIIDSVHYAFLVKDKKGNVVMKDHRIANITFEQNELLKLVNNNSFFQYTYLFEIDPGYYTLYVAVAEVGGWRLSGWKKDLQMFAKKDKCFQISPLLIATKIEDTQQSSTSNSISFNSDGTIVYKNKKLYFSSMREFPSNGILAGLYQIYNAGFTASSKPALQITFKLYDEAGNIISSLPPKEINEFSDFLEKIITNFFILPYKNLSPQKYKLELEVVDLITKCSSSSDIEFKVKD